MKQNKVFIGSKKRLLQTIKKIFDPIKNNESCTLIWFPTTGKSIILREILNSREIIKKEFGERYKSVILLFLDINSIITKEKVLGFFQLLYLLIMQNLEKKKKISIHQKNEIELVHEIKNNCNKLLMRGFKIVFVINEIETVAFFDRERIIQGITNIISLNRNSIHSIMNLTNLDTLSILEKNEMNYTLLQNLIFIRLPSKEETDKFINVFQKRWNFKLNKKQRAMITFLEGSNLLTKASLRIFRKREVQNIEELLEQREIKLKSQLFFNQIGKKEKQVLERTVFLQEIETNELKFVKAYLAEIGVLKKKKRKWVIRPEIISYLVKINNQASKLQISNNGELIFGLCNLVRLLSPSEYKILQFLFKNTDKVCSRYQIAKKIWEKNHLDKYSNWAIDQIMSRIRRKLHSVGVSKKKIVTVKNKGFKLQSKI